MKKRIYLMLAAAQFGAICLTAAVAAGAVCTPIPETSFTFGGFSNLNAAVVNPSMPVTGTVDATGCQFAVYYSPGTAGSVSNATIFGAMLAGIVNNGANVKIDSNAIYQIGDNPLGIEKYGLPIYVDGWVRERRATSRTI